jgi:hypothetical protein
MLCSRRYPIATQIMLQVSLPTLAFSVEGYGGSTLQKSGYVPRFSVDLIKGLQMSRAKPKLTQIFHLSSGVLLTFFLGTIFVGIVGRRP